MHNHDPISPSDLIGRTIKDVDITRGYFHESGEGPLRNGIESLTLDDGTVLKFSPCGEWATVERKLQ